MAAASKFDSVVTNPGGTGSTITPALSTHAVGDVIEIFISKTGNASWTPPAGWTIVRQTVSPGTASTATVGTLIQHKVVSGDTLPLASPVCNLGATVTRHAIARTVRGADLEGVYTLAEWVSASTSSTNNPIRPPSVTTPAPEMFVTHYYCQRVATNAPEPTGYTQDREVITSGTLVTNVSEKTVADQQTVLSNQDVSPTSGGRWVGMISCVPSPDYPYYRSGSQAFNANATNVTPNLPAGTTANDNRGNKDLIVATVECAGTPTITPNTPADWTALPDWSNTTSGGGTTVRKYATLYDGTLDRQFNRSTSGEIFVYFSVYHNANQTIPIGTSATQQNTSSTTSTFPALARTGTKATIQATCVADATPTFTAPGGWTERNDSQGVTCADQSFNATGTTASASFTLNSASPTLCGLMEVFSVASVINLILTPASVSITATGQVPQLITGLTSASTSLSLNTFAPAVSTVAATVITPATATLSVSAFASQLVLVITPATATIAITSFAPNAINGILYDSATDTNGTDLADHIAEVGGGWTKHAGFSDALTIQSNRIGKDANTGTTVYYSDVIPSQLLYTVEADIVDVGEVDRALGPAVYIDTTTDSMIVVRRQNRTTVQFLKIVNSSPSATLASTTVVFSEGLSRRYAVRRLAGNRFEVVLDGVVFGTDIEIADAVFQSPGRIGIRASNNHNGTGYHIDRISAIINAEQGVTVTPNAALLILTTFAGILKTQITPTVAGLSLSAFTPALVETITPASQSLTLTTNAPAFVTGVVPASLALSTNTFPPDLIHTLTPSTRSLDLTTWAARLQESTSPATVSLTLSTFAPTVEIDVTIQPAPASLATTGFAPALHERLTLSAASFTLTTFAPEITISADITVIPANQALALTAFAAALQLEVRPASTSLTLNAFAPDIDISADRTVQPTSTSLTLDSFAPELRLTLTPTTATLTVSGQAPSLQLVIQPATATFTVSGLAPTVEISGDITVTPAEVSLSLVAFAPMVTTGAIVTAITPVVTSITLTAFAPWLFLGFVPARRTFMVDLGRYEVEVSAGEYEFLDSYEDDEVMV